MLYIFDWDGTLLDSAGRIVACLRMAAAEAELRLLSDGAYAEVIGLGMHEATARLYPDSSASSRKDFQDNYSRHFVREDRVPCAFFPGVLETLHKLRGRGHVLAIATGKSRRGLNRVMGSMAVSALFDCTRCADETASKPDPRMIIEILAETGHRPQAAVMIGDTEYDLDMAQRAGVRSIGVSYGVHTVDRLRAHGPEMVIDSLERLLD